MTPPSERTNELSALFARAERGAIEVLASDRYKEYLATMARFYDYSFRNSLLVFLQNPEATRVAGRVGWQANHNRQVLSGEKGIQIIGYAPRDYEVSREKKDDAGNIVYGADGTPVTETVIKRVPEYIPVYVYDISQTMGEPLPELEWSAEFYQDLFSAIKVATTYNIAFEDIPSGAIGYSDLPNRKIAIQEGMEEKRTIKAAIHEITHAGLQTSRRSLVLGDNKDRRTRELEADSMAYVICARYGIDTSDYSFSNLAAWSSGKEFRDISVSLAEIQKRAGYMINKIESGHADISRERKLAISAEIGFDHVRQGQIDSVIHDNDIDLDREKTRAQLGFRDDAEKPEAPAARGRASMRERFAAAAAEADRRNAERDDARGARERPARDEETR